MVNNFGPRVNDLLVALLTLEHRVDPLFRDAFNRAFQQPLAGLVQFLLRALHSNPETRLCEEFTTQDEDSNTRAIVDSMRQFTERQYQGAVAERAGNTKT